MSETCKSANDCILKVGDVVNISGDIDITEEIVSISYQMKTMINDTFDYRIRDIKRSLKDNNIHVVLVNDWWWSQFNIHKKQSEVIDPRITNNKTDYLFDEQLLNIEE